MLISFENVTAEIPCDVSGGGTTAAVWPIIVDCYRYQVGLRPNSCALILRCCV